ncbi:MAG TPA: hypothetical protein VKW08_28060 [Xanthobacteraceae bacterium]|jgi:hypothetical protein|nr:hypothetical protein [Xanthobacteraceae bacterium]
MSTKSKTLLAAALLMGALGTISTAYANDIDESASAAQAAREAKGNQLPWWWNNTDQARVSFAYQPAHKAARQN